MQKILFVCGVMLIALAATLDAAGPNTTTTSSIALNPPSASAAAPALWPSLGTTVSFTVTFPKQVQKSNPGIQILCYQNGTLVYGETAPYYSGFTLGGSGSTWLTVGGQADCEADLYYWSYSGGQKFNLLASTTFTAYGS